MQKKTIIRLELRKLRTVDGKVRYWQLIYSDGENSDLKVFATFREALAFISQNLEG